MKQKPPADAVSIGTFLSDPRLSVRPLLDEAERLARLQSSLRDWATAPWAQSLVVAAERDGVLIVHCRTAAALTEIRYRQTELLDHLRRHCALKADKLLTKIVPTG